MWKFYHPTPPPIDLFTESNISEGDTPSSLIVHTWAKVEVDQSRGSKVILRTMHSYEFFILLNTVSLTFNLMTPKSKHVIVSAYA